MNAYISLTTVPKRLKNIIQFLDNLNSLVNQKTDIDYKIILNIPRSHALSAEAYDIPNELLEFQKLNLKLIINRIDKDYGPITKIIGSLCISKDPEDILIVCDDDQCYHEEMLEYHLKMREKYNQKVAICFRGDTPITKRYIQEEPKKYVFEPLHTFFPVKEDRLLAIPGHWHSVSYKRKFFEEDFFNEDFLNLCDNDDYLMGYYLKKKKILIVCCFWDKETDLTPVNENFRPAWSFPIKYQISHEDSGFNDYRKLSGNHMGRLKNEVMDYIHDNSIIYEE